MDIIDIMLAKALTPQGQVETYAAKARKAAQDAAAAEANAEAAAEALEDAAQAKSDAESALADVQAALEALESANTITTNDIDAEVKKMTVNTNTVSGQTANTLQVITTYPDNTLNTQNITKLYKSTGNNEDGAMTQKAITDALTQVAQTAAQNSGNSSSANTNLGENNEGKIVIINSDGNIISGTVSEDELIEILIQGGNYNARNALGLQVDYDNKSFIRIQEAYGKNIGSDFNSYIMYGGRTRCNVADDGTITAFYGDNNYSDDGSNGQVMVYQPKFYYQRIPISTQAGKSGKVITQDSIMISSTAQSGFKLHPIFKGNNGEELDYVLFSAYEGSLYDVSENSYPSIVTNNVDFDNDKLSSVIDAKPITGSSGLSLEKAEQLANNRGSGWHIMTMAAESANQMLEIIEFGTLNGQSILGNGVSDLSSSGISNSSAITGATASLGNTSGAASETIIENNGVFTTETINGKVSISYRGVENPWGNVWQMLNGIIISGNTTMNGGIPHICTDTNYSYNQLTSNYESVEFCLPNNNGWISNFGYGNRKYDWLFMPIECGSGANSALPVGDNGWFTTNLTGIRMVVQGGGWSFEDSDGLFYYGCDKAPNDSTYKSYGARLLFIPTKNNIYTSNITKWQQKMNIGG